MKKRMLSLLLAVIMMAMVTACDSSQKDRSETLESDFEKISTESGAESTELDSEMAASTEESSGTGTTINNASDSNDKESPKNQTTSSGSEGATTKVRNYTIKTGKKGLEEGLNFGGKTFTMATYSAIYDTSFTRRLNSFQTKYNCKIQVESLNFNEYVQKAGVKKAAGTPYDVLCYVHGSMFPNLALSQVAMPLTDLITTADLCDSKNPFNGGFDLDKSDAFEWQGQLYALAGYDSVFPYLLYYNKLKFEEAGLDDPVDLYKKGKWNWSKLVSMGKEVTNSSKDIYFGCESFYGKVWVLANGGHYITTSNGAIVENLTSPQIVNALTWLQGIMTGNDRIVSSKGGSADPSQFYKGNTYVYAAESNRYPSYAEEIVKQSAFGYDLSNLGVAPVPLGPDNKKSEYPTGWVNAHAAGAGTSDVRVALAWAKFMTTYKDPVQDTYAMPKTDKQMVQKLISGNINYPDYGYATSSTSVNDIVVKLEYAIAGGQSVSKTLESYRNQVQNCIDAVIK